MRNCILILLLTIIFPHFSQSQENKLLLNYIISDSTTVQDNKIWITHFSSILNSNNKIEIRMLRAFPYECSILSFNNSWYFEKYIYDSSTKKYDTLKINNQDKLKKLFKNLVKNNIFSLPNGKRSADKYYYDLDKNLIIGKGTNSSHPSFYCLEFKIGDKFRRYYYYEPERQYSFIPENQELRQFIEITKILNKLN